MAVLRLDGRVAKPAEFTVDSGGEEGAGEDDAVDMNILTKNESRCLGRGRRFCFEVSCCP